MSDPAVGRTILVLGVLLAGCLLPSGTCAGAEETAAVTAVAEQSAPPLPKGPTATNLVKSDAALLRQQFAPRLCLVYELQVLPHGIENAAFAKLLQRHQIDLQHTAALGERERADLLRHRFLQGITADGARQPAMDEVQLYVVSCTGQQADALYQDLLGRPAGIGAFCLNLTTMAAADGAISSCAEIASRADGPAPTPGPRWGWRWRRKLFRHTRLRPPCDGAPATSACPRAVPLQGNFGVPSNADRRLGVFGRLQVDPALLMPSSPSGGTPQPAGAEALRQGDFACQLLFVVRHLKPLAESPAKPCGPPAGASRAPPAKNPASLRSVDGTNPPG